MEIFGYFGMIVAFAAFYRVDKLEKKLKALGVLEPEFRSEE